MEGALKIIEFALVSFLVNLALASLALRLWIKVIDLRWEVKAADARVEEAEKNRIAIVNALQAPTVAPPRPVPAVQPSKPRRVARTFGEWNKASELQAVPMGMKEKNGNPNA